MLAVIVILAIILAIAIPSITSLISNVTKNAFESDAKMIIKAIEYKVLEVDGYDPASIDETNILSELNISDDNYEIVTVTIVDGKPYIEIIGKNKWDGLTACGFYNDMEAGTDVECGIQLEEIVMPNGQLCGNNFLDDRDSYDYITIQIGTQCWMSENLRYTGDGCLTNDWNTNEPYNACRINGGEEWDQDEVLYQWWAAINWDGLNPATQPELEGSQGLCPEGWYVSTDDDWKQLEMYLGMSQEDADSIYGRGTDEGTKLKSTDPSWNGTNMVGFNAKPAGYRSLYGGGLNEVGNFGIWWTSTAYVPLGWESGEMWTRILDLDDADIYRDDYSPAGSGASVRCILENN